MGLCYFQNHKGVGVVATPDGVWHRDSHYRSQLIGGVHKLMILIKETLEDFVFEIFWDLSRICVAQATKTNKKPRTTKGD